MKLYVKNIARDPGDTLYIFLYKLLRLNNDYYKQSTVDSTYFDSEFTSLQCTTRKNRSFDDLILISKTYFKVSDKQVAKVLKRILDENKDLIFVLCDSAKKWILNRNLSRSSIIKYCSKYDYSDQKTDNSGNGVYSFDDIIKLMGLTKEDIKIEN